MQNVLFIKITQRDLTLDPMDTFQKEPPNGGFFFLIIFHHSIYVM